MAYMLALREYSSQDGFMVLLFSGQIAGAVLANAMQNCGFIGQCNLATEISRTSILIPGP